MLGSETARYYRFYNQKVTFQTANVSCTAKGGELARIDSKGENTLAFMDEAAADAWIGINDLQATTHSKDPIIAKPNFG